MKINMIRRDGSGNGLIPYSGNDFEQFQKLKYNVVYRCDIKQPRNYKHHSKYFALCRLVADNYDGDNTEEQVSYWLKKATGHTETFMINNEEITRVKSIKFDSMPQDEFEEYYNQCLPIVAELLGCNIKDIEDNLIFHA